MAQTLFSVELCPVAFLTPLQTIYKLEKTLRQEQTAKATTEKLHFHIFTLTPQDTN